MADEPIVVGIDIGTTKVCTLVARVENERNLRILGVGIEPSQESVRGRLWICRLLPRLLLARSKKLNGHRVWKLLLRWSALPDRTFHQ